MQWIRDVDGMPIYWQRMLGIHDPAELTDSFEVSTSTNGYQKTTIKAMIHYKVRMLTDIGIDRVQWTISRSPLAALGKFRRHVFNNCIEDNAVTSYSYKICISV